MRSFFAQQDHLGVLNYVIDCLNFMKIRYDLAQVISLVGWLKLCKKPALDGLWIYGVTVNSIYATCRDEFQILRRASTPTPDVEMLDRKDTVWLTVSHIDTAHPKIP